MSSADEHLEEALKDYNSKVHKLESEGGTEEELMDALINRGCILSMMEYYVSAISDFDDAIEIMAHIIAAGGKVDAGSYVKAYVSRGEIRGGDDLRPMADDYANAAFRLGELNEKSKYYDRKKIITMCVNCAEDLVDEHFPMEIQPFIDKAWSMIIGREDPWSKNRFVEILNLNGKAAMDLEDDDDAIEAFATSIDEGTKLLETAELEDVMSLVFPFVSRGDIWQKKGIIEPYISDRKAAIILLEQMLEHNRLDDVQVLSHLHQDLAHTYLTLNKVKEAEEHLMREVALSVNGAKDYINNYANRPGSP